MSARRRPGRHLGPWPRRAAALLCLLLAAVSALRPDSQRPAGAAQRPAALRPGEVGVPVPITAAATARDLRPGTFVGLLSPPAEPSVLGPPAAGPPGTGQRGVLVADHLRVLSVLTDSTGLGAAGAGTVVLVAATRELAVRLAGYAGHDLLLIRDTLP